MTSCPARVEGVDGGRADLAAGAGDEDAHERELIFRFRKGRHSWHDDACHPAPVRKRDDETVSDAPTQAGGRSRGSTSGTVSAPP